MTEAIVTTRGRVTIPAQIRVEMGIQPGDQIEFVDAAEGGFVLVPIRMAEGPEAIPHHS